MTIGAKREYLTAIRHRYSQSTKKEKGAILNEFAQVCGYSRKYAIRVLRGMVEPRQRKPGPKPLYDLKFVEHLRAVWEAMDRACSKKVVAAMPQWLPHYKGAHLSEECRRKLLVVSAATVDRLLRPFKHTPPKGLSGTKRSPLLGAIPIELIDGSIDKPGYIEADTVVHCGTSLAGEFINTLTATDLATGWTENRAIWNKTSAAVIAAIKDVEKSLPFELWAFASDNGSEFLTYDLLEHFKTAHGEKPVKMTRRRPYKKNDNAHVEQKNRTHVRDLFGYERLDDKHMVAKMNEIYRAYWNPLHNYFIPCMKLIKKERIGSRIKKTYDKPKTPCDRLMENEHVPEHLKQWLRKQREARNPFSLHKELEACLRDFTRLVEVAMDRQRREGDKDAA